MEIVVLNEIVEIFMVKMIYIDFILFLYEDF